MKLHRLELEGFGPYLERQEVDFDLFAADGIFLIAGRTGAGKSSILDGVCFALYGGVPRYEGADRRLRSDHCAPEDRTEVQLQFTVQGNRWQVTRSPEYDRPKRRGDGVTTEAARAQLDEWNGVGWETRASGPRDVALALDEILGLNQQQFLQVILLAQNRFQRFLLAKNDERQALLRTLFGTRRYEDFEKALEQRRKKAEAAVAAGAERVEFLLADAEELIAERMLAVDACDRTDGPSGSVPTPSGADGATAPDTTAPDTTASERIAVAERAVTRAQYRAEVAVQERMAADAAHTAASAAHVARLAEAEQHGARERSRAALAEREAVAPRIARDREVLDRARRAEELRATLETVTRAARAHEAAAVDEASARAAWRAVELNLRTEATEATEAELTSSFDFDAEMDADPETVLELLAGEAALAQEALAQEGELAEHRAALHAAAGDVSRLEVLRTDLDARRAALPAVAARIDGELATAIAAAAGLEASRVRRDETAERLAAANDATTLAELLRGADADHLAASDAHGRAQAAVTELLRRRLAGYAGEIAAALVDGEPCAVCGSTAHPHPAPPADDPVTEAIVDAAERARDAAATAERSAATSASDARRVHAAAAARAGDAAVGELESALASLHTEVAAATAAVAARDRLLTEREGLAELQHEVDAELEQLSTALAAAREAAAGAAARVDAGERDLIAARAGYDTVALRLDAIEERRQVVQRVVAAAAECATCARTEREAREDLDARIAASDFADALAATAALRPAAERAALEAGIREHDIAIAAERDRLRDLELALAGVPDEPIDTAASARAADEARERRDAALTAVTTAAEVADRLRRLIARAAAAQHENGDLAEEHAAVTRLAHTVAGRAPNTHRMTLETFVLAAELEEIVAAANLRLGEMSSGRYALRHTDARASRGAASGLGLEILDAYTGRARPTHSLSGGETFLASLALALGLAEVVTGRAGGLRLDTLFIDEGFGSLDAETLDLAMATLDELRQGGRTVGVISHVEAMKEQLAAQIVVSTTAQGSSVIRAVSTLAAG